MLHDMCRMTVSAAPGTGIITLGIAVVPGYQTFAAGGAVDGESFSYNISDFTSQGILTAWEVGTGTYHAAGPTLARSPLFSSNGNSAINASALAQVWITALASDFGGGGSGVDTTGPPVTAAGTDANTATVLTNQFSEVLTVAPGTGVRLPTFMGTAGNKCRIASYGASTLLLYPQAGQTFFSGGVSNGLNEPLTIQAGVVAEFETGNAGTTVYSVP
jgi:hypothetical protein